MSYEFVGLDISSNEPPTTSDIINALRNGIDTDLNICESEFLGRRCIQLTEGNFKVYIDPSTDDQMEASLLARRVGVSGDPKWRLIISSSPDPDMDGFTLVVRVIEELQSAFHLILIDMSSETIVGNVPE